jgi:hypothetical protein
MLSFISPPIRVPFSWIEAASRPVPATWDALVGLGGVNPPLYDRVMATVQVLYWQDIPSVIRSGDLKRQLPEWFQQEIDRVAMEQGLLGSDAYLEHWRWGDPEERDGSPSEALDVLEGELLAEHGR